MSDVMTWCIVIGAIGISVSVIGVILASDLRYPRDDDMPWSCEPTKSDRRRGK